MVRRYGVLHARDLYTVWCNDQMQIITQNSSVQILLETVPWGVQASSVLEPFNNYLLCKLRHERWTLAGREKWTPRTKLGLWVTYDQKYGVFLLPLAISSWEMHFHSADKAFNLKPRSCFWKMFETTWVKFNFLPCLNGLVLIPFLRHIYEGGTQLGLDLGSLFFHQFLYGFLPLSGDDNFRFLSSLSISPMETGTSSRNSSTNGPSSVPRGHGGVQ